MKPYSTVKIATNTYMQIVFSYVLYALWENTQQSGALVNSALIPSQYTNALHLHMRFEHYMYAAQLGAAT